MSVQVIRRTFEAKNHLPGSPEREALNKDPATSEYLPGQKYLVRRPYFMSNGEPNPSQKFHDETYSTKREAVERANLLRKLRSVPELLALLRQIRGKITTRHEDGTGDEKCIVEIYELIEPILKEES